QLLLSQSCIWWPMVREGRTLVTMKRSGNDLIWLQKREMLLKPHSRVQVFEGAEDNLPDRDALRAALAIRQLAEGLTADDLLLVLISGGGSALLPAPIPPVTLEEKQTLTKLLAARGATIQELNTIRKTLSQLKGGGLAQAAYPAQVVSLILSDVVGDPVEVIASGPTVASSHSVQDCLHILNRYGLRAALPRSVKTVLSRADSDPHGPHTCGHVLNVIIGSNVLALAEAQRQAEALGYQAVVLSAAMQGRGAPAAHRDDRYQCHGHPPLVPEASVMA
uniref:Glycerate kinase n=1 Tax=Saimiri boliviensis boliviensis TaxID=39432 RepID=A0A2K6TVF2_SAIBB